MTIESPSVVDDLKWKMATLEDKILGEKLHYYCSSSEDDDEDDDDKDGDAAIAQKPEMEKPEIRQWEGTSVNTGPKGVLKDWQRYKQLESEQREKQEAEKVALFQKLSLTCRSHAEDAQEKEDLDELLNDDFLKEYMQKRLQEMIGKSKNLPRFGSVITLQSGDHFLEAVDKEAKSVTIIIHLFEDGVVGCEAMDGCLSCLATEYPNFKFCRLRASTAGVSGHFKSTGVPALLVYKSGTLVGNFVRITDELGEDFFAVEVQDFLIEHGILPDKSLVPDLVRSNLSDTGSDFGVD